MKNAKEMWKGKKSCLQQLFKGGKEKPENSETEGGLAVVDIQFICKQAIKYDMTKSQRNFASTAVAVAKVSHC